MNKNAVLICGYSRAGKDTLADGMLLPNLKNLDFTYKVAFADQLKEIADEVLGLANLRHSLKDTFHNDTFKVKNRNALVHLGVAMRSIDPDVWVDLALRRSNFPSAVETAGVNLIVTDWRYLNEYRRAKELLPDFKVVTVYIETVGLHPANEEEAKSIAEIKREIPWDYEFYFSPNSSNAILKQGSNLSLTLGL
jgi:hypothetical protein